MATLLQDSSKLIYGSIHHPRSYLFCLSAYTILAVSNDLQKKSPQKIHASAEDGKQSILLCNMDNNHVSTGLK